MEFFPSASSGIIASGDNISTMLLEPGRIQSGTLFWFWRQNGKSKSVPIWREESEISVPGLSSHLAFVLTNDAVDVVFIPLCTVYPFNLPSRARPRHLHHRPNKKWEIKKKGKRIKDSSSLKEIRQSKFSVTQIKCPSITRAKKKKQGRYCSVHRELNLSGFLDR